MKKIVIVVIILALIWAIPPVRSRVLQAGEPVLEKLGPFGAKLLNPSRRYATQNEVIEIARKLREDRNTGRQPPEEHAFTTYLKTRISGEDGLDVWNSPFWMKRTADSLTVGSNGPDGKRKTEDDVTHTIKF